MFSLRAAVFAAIFIVPTPARADDVLRGVTVSPALSVADITDIRSLGANVVRFPLDRDDSSRDEDENAFYDRLESALARFDAVLPLLERQGISVILELGSPPGGFGYVRGRPQHRLFSEAWTQRAFVTGWTMIAERYKNRPSIWGYDLLNEPAQNTVIRGLKDWNKLALETAENIRGIDSRPKIIVETIYGNPSLIRRMKTLPFSGVVYSAHMYYTLKFQHQGMYGNPLGVTYPTKRFRKKDLLNHLKPLQRFAQKNRAEVYIGEFSAVRWAPGDSAYKYLRDTLEIFEQLGWHYTYHAFREAHPWSVEMGNGYMDLHPSHSPTDREMLLRQYFSLNR